MRHEKNITVTGRVQYIYTIYTIHTVYTKSMQAVLVYYMSKDIDK